MFGSWYNEYHGDITLTQKTKIWTEVFIWVFLVFFLNKIVYGK